MYPEEAGEKICVGRELIADLRKVLTHPDGEYVIIPGAIPQGRTIVMNDNDIDSLKAASLRKNLGTKPEETYVEEPEEEKEEKPVQKPVQKSAQKKRPVKKKDIEEDDDDDFDKDEEDDDDEEVNPALSKVMMALGIGWFHYTGCDYFLYYRSCGRLLWWQRQSFWPQEQRYINGIYFNRIGF